MTARDSIIGAAMKLFAEQGFEGVTVREICRCASVNVAMVNYHFKGKEGLYRECLEKIFGGTGGQSMIDLDRTVKDAETWRTALRAWIGRFSSAMHAHSEGDGVVAGVYRHEIVHPSAVCDFVKKSFAEPVFQTLVRLLRMAESDEREVLRWAASIWAQLSAYAVVAPFWRDSFQPADTDEADWGREFADFVSRQVFARLEYQA